MHESVGWAFGLGVVIIKPLLLATTTRDWRGSERLPQEGGYLLVLNHLSHVDPLTAAHFLHENGRVPRYLAKSGLFKNPALGYFLRSAGQIPVYRATKDAKGAYDAAVEAVRAGKVVVVYPEGTITRDPEQWPMTGKSGAARIALETGCPVIPVGQWGAQELLPAYSSRPHLFPRKKITMIVGEPVALEDLATMERTATVITEATDRIMTALTALVAEIRGAEPPTEPFDMRRAGVREIGNPHTQEKKKP